MHVPATRRDCARPNDRTCIGVGGIGQPASHQAHILSSNQEVRDGLARGARKSPPPEQDLVLALPNVCLEHCDEPDVEVCCLQTTARGKSTVACGGSGGEGVQRGRLAAERMPRSPRPDTRGEPCRSTVRRVVCCLWAFVLSPRFFPQCSRRPSLTGRATRRSPLPLDVVAPLILPVLPLTPHMPHVVHTQF